MRCGNGASTYTPSWMGSDPRHIPVLQTTVLNVLNPTAGERVLDCTLGLGGHAAAFLEAVAPTGSLVALDADPTNLKTATERLAPFGDRATLIHGNFRDVASLNLGTFDIVFADLGLSSPHVDSADRGFSFRFDGPLDLRYDRSSGKTAADLLEDTSEDPLVQMFHDLGELHRYVRPLVSKLAGKRIETTTALKEIVQEVFGYRAPSVLPQIFQALRIAVNDELGALQSLLDALPSLLNPGGRAGFLSYHSLEDRLVKHVLRGMTLAPKDPLTGQKLHESPFSLITKKAIVPTPEEIAENPRSRSAKFRALLHS